MRARRCRAAGAACALTLPKRPRAGARKRPQPSRRQAGRTPAAAAAPKSGKRKFVLMGVLALLALAAASYAVHYVLVGRFYVSTDDAYVRANNTTLGARVAGHIAAILPGDNVVVRTGDVIFRIDDGDYRIAVDAARAGSQPSRPPSTASAARSPRWKVRPSSPRRSWHPRKPR